MDSEFRSSTIKGAKVLMVGAGGIGCELLKTLALSGFQDIHIIDMDTIEVSNLNRQFLFRKSHVGQSKAKVASDAVSQFRPNISITPYHANVKDPQFNVDFFKKFNAVLNALDNVDARRHVNRLCLAAGVPLIDSGTTGFLGQVSVHVKGKTECYECHPKPVPKSYPVCTITSTPSKYVHCVVWAKDLLFAKLFGDRDRENDLNAAAETTADAFERGASEDVDTYGRRIYDHVFGYNTERASPTDDGTLKSDRPKPRPLYARDVLPDRAAVNGDRAPSGAALSAAASLGLKNPQDVWCLADSSEIFLRSLRLFLDRRRGEIGSLSFDKEDELSVEFVTAAANVRASSFGIPMRSTFDAKGIAGNIVHAVATTNAVVAGLAVIEAVKALVSGNHRMTYCLQHPNRKMLLMPVEPFEPNLSCYVCSKTPVLLEVDTRAVTFGDFVEKVVRGKLGMSSPLIMHGSSLLYEVGDDLEEDLVANYESNLKKTVHEVFSPVAGHITVVTVEDLYQELSCVLNIKHGDVEGMVMSGLPEALGGGASPGDDCAVDGAIDGEKKRKLLDDGDDDVHPDLSKKQKMSDF